MVLPGRFVPESSRCSERGSRVTLVWDAEPMRLLLLAAKPLGEPVARYGPFVVTTQDEIRQAIDDFRSGTLTR